MDTNPNTYRKPTNNELNKQISITLQKFDEEENTILKNKEIKSNGGRRRSTARPLPRRRSSKRKSRKSRNTRRR